MPGGSCNDSSALLIRYLEDLYAPTPPVVTNPANPGGPTQPVLIDDLAIPASEPGFVGGNFNLRRNSFEGSWIEERLNATYPSRVTDLPWNCTYCYGINDLASDSGEDQGVLDYIVTSNAHRRPKDAELETLRLLSPRPWKEFPWEDDRYDLSDHYPVRGRFKFDRRTIMAVDTVYLYNI